MSFILIALANLVNMVQYVCWPELRATNSDSFNSRTGSEQIWFWQVDAVALNSVISSAGSSFNSH